MMKRSFPVKFTCFLVILICFLNRTSTGFASQPFQLGQQAFQNGFYKLAAAQFEQFLADSAENHQAAEAQFLLAEACYKSERYPAAIAAYQDLLSRNPATRYRDWALLGMGKSHFASQNYWAAEAALTNLILEFPHSLLIDATLYWLGDAEFKQGKFDEALAHFEALTQNHPGSNWLEQAYFSMAYIYELKREYHNAIETHAQLVALQRVHPLIQQAKFQIGFDAYQHQDFDAAIRLLKTTLAEDSANENAPFARFLLAESYFHLNQFEAAAAAFQKMSAAYPADYQDAAFYGAGWSFFRLGNFASAIEYFEKLVQEFPQSKFAASALLQTGRCHQILGQTLWGREKFLQVVQKYPEAPEATFALYEIASIDFQKQDFSQALFFFNELFEKYAPRPIANKSGFMVGECHFLMHQFDAAKAWYQKIRTRFPQSPEAERAQYQIARCEYLQRNYHTALETLDDFLAGNSGPTLRDQALFWKGETFFALREFSKARLTYLTALELNPESVRKAEINYSLGWCELLLNHFEPAKTYFSNAIKLAPTFQLRQDAQLRLADAFYRENNFDQAIELYQQFADEYREGLPVQEAQFQAANCLFKKGNFDRALQQYQNWLRAYPRAAQAGQAQYLIGQANFQNQRYGQAADDFNRLIIDYPRYSLTDEAILARGECFYNSGRYDLAIEQYQRIVQEFPNSPSQPRALSGIQWALMQQGKTKDALALIEQDLSEKTDFEDAARVQQRKAEMFLSVNQLKEAIVEYNYLLQNYPGSKAAAAANYWLGETHARSGKHQLALDYWQKQVNDYPQNENSATALHKLGSFYFSQKNPASGLPYFRQLVENFPNHPHAFEAGLELGSYYLNQKDTTEAGAAYSKIVAHAGFRQVGATARIRLARLLLATGKAAQLQELLTPVVENQSDELGAEAQFLISEADLQQENLRDAVYGFLRVKYLFPFSDKWCVQSIYRAAEIYEQLSNFEEAKKLYELIHRQYNDKDFRNRAKEKIKKLEKETSKGN
jgi:TolA-binding protein